MNIDQVHIPQRLEGESTEGYKSRRRMSKRLQQRTTLVWSSNQGTYFKPYTLSPQRPGSQSRRQKRLEKTR